MDMAPAPGAAGLTMGASDFIEDAQRAGRYFIHQPYELYPEADHEARRAPYAQMAPRRRQHAGGPFLRGLDALRLDPCRVPRLEHVNRFLAPLTGFRAVAVSGFLPAFLFFDCLRRREFPTTVALRDVSQSFAPRPGVFHDVTGHAPMHTAPAFADVRVRSGECAHAAVDLVSGMADQDEQVRRLTSMIRAGARFFRFTVETGLMRDEGKGGGLKVDGSALLSSASEIDRAVNPALVQQYPLQLEWAVSRGFLQGLGSR